MTTKTFTVRKLTAGYAVYTPAGYCVAGGFATRDEAKAEAEKRTEAQRVHDAHKARRDAWLATFPEHVLRLSEHRQHLVWNLESEQKSYLRAIADWKSKYERIDWTKTDDILLKVMRHEQTWIEHATKNMGEYKVRYEQAVKALKDFDDVLAVAGIVPIDLYAEVPEDFVAEVAS